MILFSEISASSLISFLILLDNSVWTEQTVAEIIRTRVLSYSNAIAVAVRSSFIDSLIVFGPYP